MDVSYFFEIAYPPRPLSPLLRHCLSIFLLIHSLIYLLTLAVDLRGPQGLVPLHRFCETYKKPPQSSIRGRRWPFAIYYWDPPPVDPPLYLVCYLGLLTCSLLKVNDHVRRHAP